MRLEAKAIDPIAIRYSTCGDWEWLPDGAMKVTVPNYGNREDSAFLVALHEMVEAFLCKGAGVTELEVSGFDKAHPELEEPGDSRLAPYHKQHVVATNVEKLVCEAAGIKWDDHNEWVTNSANEVDRNLDIPAPRLAVSGPRFWAELHLYGIRHTGKNSQGWLNDWVAAIPFDKCPCKDHFDDFVADNPPDWKNFFQWGIDLHNSVNLRTGKPTMDIENARLLWESRLF
jgi:hypothetical protein